MVDFAADSLLERAGFEPSVPESNRSFGDNPNRPPGPLLYFGKMRLGRQMRPAVRIPFAPEVSRQTIGSSAAEPHLLFVIEPAPRTPSAGSGADKLEDPEECLQHRGCRHRSGGPRCEAVDECRWRRIGDIIFGRA